MPHDRQRRRRRRLLVLLLVAMALLLWWCHRPPPLVIGTFNIRTFPDTRTDRAAVAAAIAELDADAFTVQEIQERGEFEDLLVRVNALTGRRYATAFAPYCRPHKPDRPWSIGVVYDAARIDLITHRSLTGSATCPKGQPPGALALLQPHEGPPLALASVHFKAGGEPEQFEERSQQWAWLTAALPALRAELDAPIVIAGDVNSTGFLDPDHPERRFIDDLLDTHDLALPTATIGCSEYWRPGRTSGPYEASLLDHILLPSALTFSRPEVLGMCAALACAPQQDAPPGYATISDHCPVRVALHL